MTNVWISAAGLCGATIIGSILGFGIKELPHKWNDTLLGYCAGVMLAASTLGLIVPAFESTATPWWLVAFGVMAGALFLNVLDFVTPHLHHITGLDAEEHRNNSTLNHILLFVMAIAIHKLPEGIAAGVSMSEGDEASLTVSLGIALQNIPEGMVIIAPMLAAGVSPVKTFVCAMVTGLIEVVGTFLGYWAVSIASAILPFALAFAGGTMLYVISDEMIPETHHDHESSATYALLVGFCIMLISDVLLG